VKTDKHQVARDLHKHVLLEEMSQNLVDQTPHKQLPVAEQLDKQLARLQPAGQPLHPDSGQPVRPHIGHGKEVSHQIMYDCVSLTCKTVTAACCRCSKGEWSEIKLLKLVTLANHVTIQLLHVHRVLCRVIVCLGTARCS